jgi:hypothetical protein
VLSLQCFEQGFGLLEVSGVKALSESAIDLGQELMGVGARMPGRLPGEGGGEAPVSLLKGLERAERFGEAFDLVFTQEAMKYLHPIAKLVFQDNFDFKDPLERPNHLVPLRIDVLLV